MVILSHHKNSVNTFIHFLTKTFLHKFYFFYSCFCSRMRATYLPSRRIRRLLFNSPAPLNSLARGSSLTFLLSRPAPLTSSGLITHFSTSTPRSIHFGGAYLLLFCFHATPHSLRRGLSLTFPLPRHAPLTSSGPISHFSASTPRPATKPVYGAAVSHSLWFDSVFNYVWTSVHVLSAWNHTLPGLQLHKAH